MASLSGLKALFVVACCVAHWSVASSSSLPNMAARYLPHAKATPAASTSQATAAASSLTSLPNMDARYLRSGGLPGASLSQGQQNAATHRSDSFSLSSSGSSSSNSFRLDTNTGSSQRAALAHTPNRAMGNSGKVDDGYDEDFHLSSSFSDDLTTNAAAAAAATASAATAASGTTGLPPIAAKALLASAAQTKADVSSAAQLLPVALKSAIYPPLADCDIENMLVGFETEIASMWVTVRGGATLDYGDRVSTTIKTGATGWPYFAITLDHPNPEYTEAMVEIVSSPERTVNLAHWATYFGRILPLFVEQVARQSADLSIVVTKYNEELARLDPALVTDWTLSVPTAGRYTIQSRNKLTQATQMNYNFPIRNLLIPRSSPHSILHFFSKGLSVQGAFEELQAFSIQMANVYLDGNQDLAAVLMAQCWYLWAKILHPVTREDSTGKDSMDQLFKSGADDILRSLDAATKKLALAKFDKHFGDIGLQLAKILKKPKIKPRTFNANAAIAAYREAHEIDDSDMDDIEAQVMEDMRRFWTPNAKRYKGEVLEGNEEDASISGTLGTLKILRGRPLASHRFVRTGKPIAPETDSCCTRMVIESRPPLQPFNQFFVARPVTSEGKKTATHEGFAAFRDKEMAPALLHLIRAQRFLRK